MKQLNKSQQLIKDYKELKPQKKKTYIELTKAERSKLRYMLESGHRLNDIKKPLKLSENKDEAAYFHYMNPFPWVRLIKATLRGVEAFKINPTNSITIIDKNWQTTLDDFNLNIRAIRAKLCQELKGKDALVMIEIAFLYNDILAVHCQGIQWGDITQEEILHLKTRFNSGITDIEDMAEGFEAVPITKLAGAIAYMIKLPTYRYKMPQYRGANKTERLSNRECYRIYEQIHKDKPVSYFDMMIGIGEGVKLKAAIMEYLGIKSYVKLDA